MVVYFKDTDRVGYDKELAFHVIKRTDGVYSIIAGDTIHYYAIDEIPEYPAQWNDQYATFMNNFNAACGDADGNGQNETLIAFAGSVFLIGDSDKDYGPVQTISYEKSADTFYKLLKVSAGDLDNDGMDEFVVAESNLQEDINNGTAEYHIYTGITMSELDNGTISVTEGAETVVLRAAGCSVGDLDADGLSKVLFIGPAAQSPVNYLMILDQTWNEDNGRFNFGFIPDFESFDPRFEQEQYFPPACAVADFDGDGKKEILGQQYIYENLSETGGSFTKKSTVDDIHSPVNVQYPLGSTYDISLAVGDIDGDIKADIAYISDAGEELYCLGFNDAGEWVRKGTGDILDHGDYPHVTMGDYDGDSIAVEFVESEILFSDPHPIALLASNPFWNGVDMDGTTSFGTMMGNEVEREKSLGFSVGFSVGYESEGPFNLWSASVKATFEASFDWTATESVAIVESYTYSTGSEDKVIFTTVPYDVYYYQVISAPDPEMVGSVITVNLPRKAITLPVERGFYNSHNGGAPDIDTVLTHVPGDPLSYPTKDDAVELVASGGGEGIVSTDMLTVGQGTGGTAIEMSVTNANGAGFAFDISVSIEASVGAGGFTVGANAGFHYGEKYSITTSDGMIYKGEVGNIPEDDFDLDRVFSWGLFSYRGALGAERFIVVQYYTESI